VSVKNPASGGQHFLGRNCGLPVNVACVTDSRIPAVSIMAEKSVYYQCQRCTNCCRWPGDVKVTEEETGQIAAFLGLEVNAFVESYTRLRADRRGLSIIDRPDHSCIFLEGNNCVINAVKPQQCRDFPNKWNFPGWRQVCEAIPVERETPLAPSESLENANFFE
jgi:Fe-S-cluster containining protein